MKNDKKNKVELDNTESSTTIEIEQATSNNRTEFPLEYSIIESPFTVNIISSDNTPGKRPGCCGKCNGDDSCSSNKEIHEDKKESSSL